MRFLTIFLFSIIFLGISCTKDPDLTTVIEEPFVPVIKEEVNTLVISASDLFPSTTPFSCIIDGEEYFSQQSKILYVENLPFRESGYPIVLKAEGHFDEIRHIYPTEDGHINLHVQMRAEKFADLESFGASEGGTIKSSSVDITIDPYSLVDVSGNTYEGNVNVWARRVHGTYIFGLRAFPHNQIIEDGQSSTMNTLGGVNLILRDEMMNPLFLKEGSFAKISYEISEEEVDIPNDLEMRYFDKVNSEWRRLGIAEKEGEKWVGNVSELGMLICGIPHESRVAQLRFVTEGGVIIPNALISVYTKYKNHLGIGFSDSQGNLRIHVPIDQEFRLRHFIYATNSFHYKEYSNVTSGEGIIVLDDFVVPSDEDFTIYNGETIDCDGELNKTSAMVISPFEEEYYQDYVFADKDGKYRFAHPKAAAAGIFVYFFDYHYKSISSGFLINIEDHISTDFGSYWNCGQHEYFINYKIDDEFYNYTFENRYSFVNNESILTSSVFNGANHDNKTVIVVDDDEEGLGPSSKIKQLSIKYNIGNIKYSFVCYGDCDFTMNIEKVTDDCYEGYITQNGNSVGFFRIPRN